jgi:hypothetical protein
MSKRKSEKKNEQSPITGVGTLFDNMADELDKAGNACRVKYGTSACKIFALEADVLRGVGRIEQETHGRREVDGEGKEETSAAPTAVTPAKEPRGAKRRGKVTPPVEDLDDASVDENESDDAEDMAGADLDQDDE